MKIHRQRLGKGRREALADQTPRPAEPVASHVEHHHRVTGTAGRDEHVAGFDASRVVRDPGDLDRAVAHEPRATLEPDEQLREDVDAVFVVFDDLGQWGLYTEPWREGDPELSCPEAAARGMPKRGAGMLTRPKRAWRRLRLGHATLMAHKSMARAIDRTVSPG